MQVKVLLLANQPERTTRLRMFEGTLKDLGYEVVVPRFDTRNWIRIAGLARKVALAERPDVVHIFNVPDIIYHNFPNLKGEAFKKLIYDYRSPWGVELTMSFGRLAGAVGERFEREVASGADVITSVNGPLAEKVASYKEAKGKAVYIVPNYPARGFAESKVPDADGLHIPEEEAIVFMGRISQQEGIGSLLRLAKEIPQEKFWLIGDGPFAWWYLRKLPENARFFGWQPHDKLPSFLRKAKLCLILLGETLLTPYATDRSVWKLNEYLCMEKIVVATGITKEENRKNLVVVKSSGLKEAVLENLDRNPEKLSKEDYRYWDSNDKIIKEVYESL
jgi:glycosyltransferase involved in cell wall biosynthesis